MKANFVLEMLESGELDVLKEAAEKEIREQAYKQAGGDKIRLKAIQEFAKRAKAEAEAHGRTGDDGAWIDNEKMCILDGYSVYRLNQIYSDVTMASDGCRFNLDAVMKSQGERYHVKAGDILAAYTKAKTAAKVAGIPWKKAGQQHIVAMAGSCWNIEFLKTFAQIMGDCDIIMLGTNKPLYGKNEIGEGAVCPIIAKPGEIPVCEILVERR